jgi:excinuclease ABC subunit C
VEALILESNLIKEYRPRYNVDLKDDKRYPHIKITLQEPFPRVLVTRIIAKDGAKYFGPYTAAHKMRITLKTLRSIFPIRSCSYKLPAERPERECLDYHIGKCQCPCMGHQSEEEYRGMIDEVCLFLSGKQEEVKKRIKQRMQTESVSLRFEKAALLRDRLAAIESVSQKQRVLSARLENYDVVALSRDENIACGVILKVREGKLLGIEHHYMGNVRNSVDAVILSLFMARYYLRERDFPDQLLLPFEFEDLKLILAWLEKNGQAAIKVAFPKRGEKNEVLQLATRNAQLFLEELRAQREKKLTAALRPLDELKKVFSLDSRPSRIACFDVSNLGESFAVGSVAVFQDGKPDKSGYRRFKIQTVNGQDDYAMMKEIISRFAANCTSGEEEVPDLVVVDGGKGQLSAATEALQNSGLDIPLVALAKREEELFLPGSTESLHLSRRSEALSLLIRLRNEAHRFAISYHRKSRTKAMTRSILEEVRGIGPKRKKKLMDAFGSIDTLAAASPGEIARLGEIPIETAHRLKEHLGEANER